MNDKTSLKRCLFLFHKQASRLLKSEFDDSPLPLQRFLEHIEAEPIIREYINDCTNLHTPEGFSAISQCDEVAADYYGTFGPFSTNSQEESAQVYLILKELVARNAQGRSNFFMGYGTGSKKWQDKYRGFLDSVAQRLIDNIDCHLNIIGIESGLDDSGDAMTTIFNAPVGSAQVNQATGQSVVKATQQNGVASQELSKLLNEVFDAARSELGNGETLQDIEENLNSIREQIMGDSPKRGIIRGSVSLLKNINAGVQFSAALAALIEFLIEHGITIPL